MEEASEVPNEDSKKFIIFVAKVDHNITTASGASYSFEKGKESKIALSGKPEEDQAIIDMIEAIKNREQQRGL